MNLHLLGCGFGCDSHGVLFMDPTKYLVDKMMGIYQQLYGYALKKCCIPLIKNDHVGLDKSEFLDKAGIQQYQSLIRALLQLIISIGRVNIKTAVMTLSDFRTQPCLGHLQWI